MKWSLYLRTPDSALAAEGRAQKEDSMPGGHAATDAETSNRSIVRSRSNDRYRKAAEHERTGILSQVQ